MLCPPGGTLVDGTLIKYIPLLGHLVRGPTVGPLIRLPSGSPSSTSRLDLANLMYQHDVILRHKGIFYELESDMKERENNHLSNFGYSS